MHKDNRHFASWLIIISLIASVGTILSTIWLLVSDNFKIVALLLAISIVVAIILGNILSPRIYGKTQKHGKLLLMIAIGIIIPCSSYFLIEQSASTFLAYSIQALCIILIVYLSKEWRSIQPPKPSTENDQTFQWLGVVRDEVGRGSGNRYSDGAPDATFKLCLPKSDKFIRKMKLCRLKPVHIMNGEYKLTRQVWRTDKHPYNWVLAVLAANIRIFPDHNDNLNISLNEPQVLILCASDQLIPSAWFESGQRYEIEITYTAEDIKPDYYLLTIP